MLLTIDAGNTRTKWAVFNTDGVVTNYGACLNHELSTVNFQPAYLGYSRVTISNVAGRQHANLLTEILAPYALPVRWIKASSQACSVINHYTSPESLGSDRWAALIAAWHIKQSPCIVVNAGTAVTIDALNVHPNNTQVNNESLGAFIGGLILPGLSLMQQSLGLATAQLPKELAESTLTTQTHTDIFATNTADAIQSGAIHAIVGAITLMAQTLHMQSKQTPTIIISGGNAQVIYKYMVTRVTSPVSIVDNLVLQGLFLLENAMPINSAQSELQ